MANVKNFGLVGVGGDVQFAKAGPRIIPNLGVFQLRDKTNAADAALTAGGITSSGNVSLTTGSVILSSNLGVITLGNAGNISNAGAGVYKFSGTGAMILPMGTTGQEPAVITNAGGMRYNTDGHSVEYSNGTSWITMATGDTAVTAVSVASANGFAGTSSGGTTPSLTLTTSITGLLKGNGTAISAAVSGTDIKTVGGVSLLGTGDVGVIGAAYGGTGVDNTGKTITLGGNISTAGSFTTTGANSLQFITSNTTSLTLPTSGTLATVGNTVASFSAGTTGFTPSTATTGAVALSGTLNATHGGTGLASFSSGNVLYASADNTWATAAPGATSGIQAYDAGLAALAAQTSTGIMVRTGAETYDSVSLTQPAAGITISNADGIAGSPTFALANDLAAVEGLATTGYAVRTADGAWTTRSMNVIEGDLVITGAANGVLTDTTFGLATVTQGSTGTSFRKIELDSKGRVINNTAVVAADITTLVDATYVNVSGDTMTGDLNMGNYYVTMNNAPTTDTQAANKAYVDSVAAGLSWKTSALVASTGNLTLSGLQTVDGVVLAAGNRVLVKNQTVAADNGIYVVVDGGAWTRTTDANSPAELDSATIFVQQGTANSDTGWTQTTDIVTVGTTSQTWAQFSGSSTYVWGTGLASSGNTVFVNLGAGIKELPSDEIGIDVAANKAVQLSGTATGDQLTFVLDGAGLEQSASGLKISAGGVTNAMLAYAQFTLNGDAGTDSLILGDTLQIKGTSTQGISTATTESSSGTSTVTITAADASASQKGVAKFNATEFSVTAGDVAIGLIGATKGGTGFSSYTVGDILYASSTTALSKLAVGTSGTVLHGGTTPTYSAVSLTADVSGILPAANGGTGVSNTGTITLGANNVTLDGSLTTSGAFASTFTMTGVTGVTFPTSGTLISTATIAANAVTSFQTSLSGLTPNTATNGAVTLAGTLGVASGGTGATTLGSGQVMIGNGTGAVLTSSALSFATDKLTIGSATIQGAAAGDTTITSTTTNGNIVINPTGTGALIVGPAGAGLVQSDAGTPLTVRGNTTLALASGTGSTTFLLSGTSANKVNVSGPTAAQYATSLADTNLVNKYYVDQVASTGSAGDVKGVTATFSIAATGTFNIGAALPVGSTILKVKANITAADTGTGTLSIGKAGSVAAYMTTDEVDNQTVGMYIAEDMVVEAGSEQVIGTVAGTPAGAGVVTVYVEYQLA